MPDYLLFPVKERQEAFVRAYVLATSEGNEGKRGGGGSDATCSIGQTEEDEGVRSLLKGVHAYVLANHLYWCLWAIDQADMEGCEDFDYQKYVSNRFGEYLLQGEGKDWG